MSHLEIEKRYLCRANEITSYLNNTDISYIIQKIEQFYLIAKPGETLRYRKQDNQYIKNSKKGSGLVRQESEKEVSKKEYKNAKAKNSGGVIKKIRYKFIIDGNLFELDIFKGKLESLAILEIEFKDVDSANSFIMPTALEPFIVKDITNENIYSNGALSRSMQVPLRSDSKLSLNDIKNNAKQLAKPKFDLYISDYEDSKDALLNTIERLLLSYELNLSIFFKSNEVKYLKVANRALTRVKALVVSYSSYIKKTTRDSILFNINNILLHFEEALSLQNTLQTLIKTKHKMPPAKQLKILKETIAIAQKEKIARENIDKDKTTKLLTVLKKSIKKAKFKDIKKPYSYLKEPVVKYMHKQLKNSTKSSSVVTIYNVLKNYKSIKKYLQEPFEFKKEYKKLKKANKQTICSSNSKVCKAKKFKKLLKSIAFKL